MPSFFKNIMRLDKFLKISRIIKRRTLAKEACDKGLCSLNDKLAKAGDEVKIGDILEIRLGSRTVKAEVLSLEENTKKEDSKAMYRRIEWILSLFPMMVFWLLFLPL